MGRKKTPTSTMNVAEKQNTDLAKRLDGLITDVNALKNYLGISAQAINQYRLGISRPSIENLCKIADYYNVTTDYLLGRTEVKTIDENIITAAKTTGLTENALQKIKQSNLKGEYSYLINCGYLEDIAHCISLYKEHLLSVYLEDYKSKIAAEKAKKDGAVFVDLHIERSRNDAERRGYKADLIELALKITQGIDSDFREKYGDDDNDPH